MNEADDTYSTDGAAEAERVDVDALIQESGVRLGAFDPVAEGKALGMKDRAIKFGLNLLAGMDQTAAARAAGFAGDGSNLRSKAHKAANTKAMKRFMATAEKFKAGIVDGPLGDDEKLVILAKLSRSSNPAMQIRAIAGHEQLVTDLRRRSVDALTQSTPADTLTQIAKLGRLGAYLADELARVNSFPFSSVEALAMPSAEASQYQQTQAAVRAMIEGHSTSMMNGSEMAGAQG